VKKVHCNVPTNVFQIEISPIFSVTPSWLFLLGATNPVPSTFCHHPPLGSMVEYSSLAVLNTLHSCWHFVIYHRHFCCAVLFLSHVSIVQQCIAWICYSNSICPSICLCLSDASFGNVTYLTIIQLTVHICLRLRFIQSKQTERQTRV